MGDMVLWVRKPAQGVTAHPLTATHFTAAKLATRLRVDEGQLACPLLMVHVVGQALLSLLSAEFGAGANGQTEVHNLWMSRITFAISLQHSMALCSEQEGQADSQFFPSHGGVHPSQEGGNLSAGPSLLPLPTQVDHLGHIVAQLNISHLTSWVNVPEGQVAAMGWMNQPRRKTSLTSMAGCLVCAGSGLFFLFYLLHRWENFEV